MSEKKSFFKRFIDFKYNPKVTESKKDGTAEYQKGSTSNKSVSSKGNAAIKPRTEDK